MNICNGLESWLFSFVVSTFILCVILPYHPLDHGLIFLYCWLSSHCRNFGLVIVPVTLGIPIFNCTPKFIDNIQNLVTVLTQISNTNFKCKFGFYPGGNLKFWHLGLHLLHFFLFWPCLTYLNSIKTLHNVNKFKIRFKVH